MTKSDIVTIVADKTGMSKAAASDALDAVVEAIVQSISEAKPDEGLRLPGLGSFVVRKRAARTGRNPRTGAEIQIPASYSVGFKPSKNLKEAAGS